MTEVRYAVKLEGVSPLVMNSNTSIGVDKGRDPGGWEREHFRERCYTDPSGTQLVIPSRALKKCLMVACKFMVRKPKGVSFKSYAPFIESSLVVPSDAVLDVTLDRVVPFTTMVNLDPSKGPKGPRGPRTRPLVPTALDGDHRPGGVRPDSDRGRAAGDLRAGRQAGRAARRAHDRLRALPDHPDEIELRSGPAWSGGARHG